ncbi:hypothetical protein ABFS82_03G033300 [Erythranthe guttata]
MSKLLVEFLQEQQEPFALDNYLLERGYSKGSTTSSALRNSARFLKKSASLGLRKRREIVPKCSEFVRAVCGRNGPGFILLHNITTNHNIKNRGNNGGRKNSNTREKQHANEEDKYYLSSISGTTVFDSCSESDVGDDAHCSQVERKLKWRYMEDCNKKLCPVSILQETKEGSPFHDTLFIYSFGTNSTEGESSTTSFSQFKSKRRRHNITTLPVIINKRALQQNKQLLLDYVREVIKKYRKKDGKIFEIDELWKLVCENVWIWSKDSIDENSIIQLLRYDFMESSLQEWSTADSEQHKEDLSMLIGDAVLEGIIDDFITTLTN